MQHRPSSSQRVYEELKASIMLGSFARRRLDIQRLADRMRVSPTPVREALARLAAERLIEFNPGHGYSAEILPAAKLCELYAWSAQLIQLVLGAASIHPRPREREPGVWRHLPMTIETAHAHAISALFFDIARAQPNEELAERMAHANDRLFLARSCEPLIFAEAQSELTILQDLWEADARAALGETLKTYHQSRIERARDLVQQLKLKYAGPPV